MWARIQYRPSISLEGLIKLAADRCYQDPYFKPILRVDFALLDEHIHQELCGNISNESGQEQPHRLRVEQLS